MKKTIFLLWLLVPFQVCSQPSSVPRGTLIVSAICEDGILIASDSRGSFTLNDDTNGIETVYAYVSEQKKIFNIGGFQMGITGLTMLGKKFFHQLTNDFNKSHKSNPTIKSTFHEFINYLREKKLIPEKEIFGENQYILAGYQNSSPVIFYHGYSGETELNKIGSIAYSDKNFKPYINLPRGTINTCLTVAPYLESWMSDFAKKKDKNDVGGPFNVIQIKPDNSVVEIKGFESKKYRNYKAMAKDIIDNKVQVNYLYDNSEELLKKTLNDGILEGY